MIDQILKAKKIKEIIDVSKFDTEYKRVVKLIHPDICKDPRASEAFAKFQQLKFFYENGFKFQDDSGTITIKEEDIFFDVDMNQYGKSLSIYSSLYSKATPNFKKYLPTSASSNKVTSAVPLNSLIGVNLPEEHVRWILNRLLEFSAYMENLGYAHLGLNLESFLVDPVSHGINVISFYHTTLLGEKVTTISAKYKNWYPAKLFKDKKAYKGIDVVLAKSIACFLLGDPSGRGVKLKGKVSDPLVNFLLSSHDNAFEAMDTYKKMLSANYETKFYTLNL